MYFSVQEQEEVNSGFKRFETRLSACALNTAYEYSAELFRVFCLNALNFFERLN